MITDLDSPSSLDPVRVGAKAAALAAARAAGAPVVPGFVVEGAASRNHMKAGAEAYEIRGSGGARLVISGEPIDFTSDLVDAGERLGAQLVARSSTLLESSGEWSGAFASYIDIGPGDLPKAVTGCWASAFSVDALERQEAAGVEPGSFAMSVLVQKGLEPEAGGWAEIHADGSVVVHGVKGSPAPLLQGWVTGSEARFDNGWSGEELIDLVGVDHLDAIKSMLELTSQTTAANRCEWALAARVWALQLARASRPKRSPIITTRSDLAELADLARVLVLAPGAIGEALVIPWAIGGIDDIEVPTIAAEVEMAEIRQLAEDLAQQVWTAPLSVAAVKTASTLADLGGSDPVEAIETVRRLPRPDPAKASRLLGLLRALRAEIAERGVTPSPDAAWHLDPTRLDAALAGEPVRSASRVGTGRWEPLVAAIVISSGTTHLATAASPGLGAGLRVTVTDPHRARSTHRSVIDSPQPVPNLASLLWDSAAVVTGSGSPAAHLFEAARALRVPAVCGLDLGPQRSQVVAVDGYSGVVASLDISLEI